MMGKGYSTGLNVVKDMDNVFDAVLMTRSPIEAAKTTKHDAINSVEKTLR